MQFTATAGSILEIYRQLLAERDVYTVSASRAVLTGQIRIQIQNLVITKKQQPLLVIDEASLIRLDVFTELHTLTPGKTTLPTTCCIAPPSPWRLASLPAPISKLSIVKAWKDLCSII